MIARIWHGYTTPENADVYEAKLKPELLPGIGKIPGYRGGIVLRRPLGDEVEFITIMVWDSSGCTEGRGRTELRGSDYPGGPSEASNALRQAVSTLRNSIVAGAGGDSGLKMPL